MKLYKGNTIFNNGSKTTDEICNIIGWNYQNALMTMKRGKTIYCKGIALKSSIGEVKSFQQLDGMKFKDYTCKIVNYKI